MPPMSVDDHGQVALQLNETARRDNRDAAAVDGVLKILSGLFVQGRAERALRDAGSTLASIDGLFIRPTRIGHPPS